MGNRRMLGLSPKDTRNMGYYRESKIGPFSALLLLLCLVIWMSRENWVLAFAYGAALATKENQEYKFFIQDNLNFSMLNNVNCGTFTSFTNSTQVSSDKFPQIQISFILGKY